MQAQGLTAQGTVTIAGPRGLESGTVTVAAWGPDHCRVAITLGSPLLRRSYTAVMSGKSAVISAPAGILRSVPLPVGPGLGCALLPSAVAAPSGTHGATLTSDASGRPASLRWSAHGRATELSYSDYAASNGVQYAATLVETVQGKAALTVHIETVSLATLSDADFLLPPPQKKIAQHAGGAQ
ncbi:MAG: hypothetical protein ACRD1E_03540 [Terriglobales bacterium]